MKICVNRDYGGFSLSGEGEHTYAKNKGIELFYYKQTDEENVYVRTTNSSDNSYNVITLTVDQGDEFIYDYKKEQGWWYSGNIERTDPALVAMVEELGSEKASGEHSTLVIIEIPDNIQWEIENSHGKERVHEVHRSW